ncbi:type II toxin-antitoxin system HicA family toxin [Roseofilum casamattae]|uniref:Type II toxin-antitoxin system HicA family toxin n=1 Tax=Roseofilum casamattae BLCC-M143 TaxID=3022442 RepID=A0ABT7BYJ9_9CYAN|nr:type II toxin-antitoxin system HicA family toxin [Roseofilum casamattae]MDJ1184273.1 type II toxin-antitoxin system HicA family toxin [Roseofilum casamattae BLCC-M143]
MSKRQKTFEKILAGSKNVSFNEFVSLVEGFGFVLERTNGSHHIFIHPDIPDLVNIQNYKGQAKIYQIKQFLQLVEQYNLTLGD